MRSDDLLKLLRVKHSEDVFVAECKDGATQMRSSHYKLDAWAMKRSWANWSTTGYEIKVSRQDWLRDTKHMEYAKLVHQMYLVCPAELIQPSEVSDGIGLLWASKNGARLFTKRKAVFRDIEPPVDLLIYVLMCRSTIDAPRSGSFNRRAEWEAFLEKDHDDWRFGRMLSGKIAERFKQRVTDVASENESLRRRIEVLEPIEAELRKRNIQFRWQPAESVVDALTRVLPEKFTQAAAQARDALTTLLSNIESVNGSN